MDTTELLRVLNAKTDGFASNYNTVHYLSNHDQERTMRLLNTVGGLSGEAAFRRNKLGATLLLTAPGMPMLRMGEEFGQATERGEYTEQKPLDWSLLNNDLNRDLWQHYRRLIALRKGNAALCSDYFEPLADMPDRCIIAFKRWSDEGDGVIVVANLADHNAGEFGIANEGIENGRWRAVIANVELEISDHRLVDTLAESEVKVYVRIA
jgi:1,4-alpha-glucan branching enzyme